MDIVRAAQALVGQGVPRLDSKDKVIGKACYANDVDFPGQLYLKALRSSVPHARVLAVDTSSAINMSGVVRVLPQLTCRVRTPWAATGKTNRY
jgi:CO/xanthine dehydrogenase Mo-binding subunit